MRLYQYLLQKPQNHILVENFVLKSMVTMITVDSRLPFSRFFKNKVKKLFLFKRMELFAGFLSAIEFQMTESFSIIFFCIPSCWKHFFVLALIGRAYRFSGVVLNQWIEIGSFSITYELILKYVNVNKNLFLPCRQSKV